MHKTNDVKKKIVMFGSGRHAKEVFKYIDDISAIDYFVDNDSKKWNTDVLIDDLHLFKVYSPLTLLEENIDNLLIVISSTYEEDIYEILKQIFETKGLKPVMYKIVKEEIFSISMITLIPIGNSNEINYEFVFYPFKNFDIIYYSFPNEFISLDIQKASCVDSENESINFDLLEVVKPDYMYLSKSNFIIINTNYDMVIKNVSGYKVVYIKAIINDNVDNKLTNRKYQSLFSRNVYPDGINLVGFIRGEFGIGQSCRLVAEAINNTELNWTAYSYEQIFKDIGYTNNSWSHKITNTFIYNINLIHVNAFEFPIVCSNIGFESRHLRYNIAFWLWELETPPPGADKVLHMIDEIWTPAEFVSNSIRKITDKPVITIPYIINAPIEEKYDRDFFNLPKDMFLFLCMFDSYSCMERKNPFGVISAYKIAFPTEDPNIGLVIKVNHPNDTEIEKLKASLSGYKNVYFILDTLPKIQVNSLILCCDVFASLHRAEGFGLVLAEAMLLGTPVIATNWSANTEFMNDDVACMVDYDFVTIEEDMWMFPFKKGNRWADPCLSQAAEYMKKLYYQKDYYETISQNAKEYIKDRLSAKRISELISDRVKEIYESHK